LIAKFWQPSVSGVCQNLKEKQNMKLHHLPAIVSLLALTGVARASVTGLDPAPLGARDGSIGFATFDSGFVDSVSGGAYGFTNIAPTSSGGSGVMTATASASMTAGSGTPSGTGERIYNGSGASSVAFNLTLNAEVFSSIDSVVLQIKYTRGDTGVLATMEDYRNFFTVTLNGMSGTSAVTVTPEASSGLEFISPSYMGVVQWTWSGLGLNAGNDIAISITSQPVGHISVDSFSIDASPVPEPSAYAAGIGALLAFVCVLRRHRAMSRAD
jgi:hypothetical protein